MATLLTTSDLCVNDNPTITYSNPDGEKVTSLQACIDIDDGLGVWTPVKYRDIPKTGTSYTFELTDAERAALFGAMSNTQWMPIYYRIKMVLDGKTSFSYKKRDFIFTPWITASVVDTNPATIALTGDSSVIVKEWSWAQASMTAKAKGGAAIDESLYIIRNGSYTGYDKTYTFEYPENAPFEFYATDSWGDVGVVKVSPPMVDYVRLTNNIRYERPDALGNVTVSCSGNWYNGSFGAVANTLTVQCRYTTSGGVFSDDWIDMSATSNGNSYSARASFKITDFVQGQSYIFETRATDKLNSMADRSDAVKSTPIFHWGENDFVFEVPVTFNAGAEGVDIGENPTLKGNVNVTGNLRLKGDGNYGNVLLFGDGTYCYISEPEDDVLHIKASQLHLIANGVYVDGYPIPILDKGIWTPTLNLSANYTTQYGWYSKMGQTVTVGFFIKASVGSGYQSTSISISGLPFTPMFSAAGGGMCSGAYVNAGWNFQCFVAETSGRITTRVQACNNTSASNLSTSATGCNYRNGGGEMTLSGTITFMANS